MLLYAGILQQPVRTEIKYPSINKVSPHLFQDQHISRVANPICIFYNDLLQLFSFSVSSLYSFHLTEEGEGCNKKASFGGIWFEGWVWGEEGTPRGI